MKLVIEEGPSVIDDNIVMNTIDDRVEDSIHSTIDEIVIPKSAKEIRWHDLTSIYSKFVLGLKITFLGDLEIIGNEAFSDLPITEINLPKTLKYIGKNAFKLCQLLERISIPDSVSFIGESAFYGCTSLQEVWLSDSLDTINNYMFCNCYNLKKAKLPSRIKKIGDFAFSGCTSLVSVSLPDSLTCVGSSAFATTGIEHLHLPKNVKKIDLGAFEWTPLKTITVDKENKVFDSRENCNALIKTHENKMIYAAEKFFVPKSITSIEIERGVPYDSIKVDPKNKRFDSREDCNAIIDTRMNTLFVMSNKTAIPSSVDSVAGSFSGLKLKKLVFPEGVKSLSASFDDCHIGELVFPSSIQKISISYFGLTSSKSSLKKIAVSPKNPNYDSRGNCNTLIDSKKNEVILASESTKIPSGVLLSSASNIDACFKTKNFFVIPEGTQEFTYEFVDDHPQSLVYVLPKSLVDFEWNLIIKFQIQDVFYYSGTYEEWKKNVFCVRGSASDIAKGLYFYSEKKPKNRIGRYWHYVNGKPKLW